MKNISKLRESIFSNMNLVSLLSLLVYIMSPFLISGLNSVHAAQLTKASVRLGRLGASQAASTSDPILIVAKPSTGSTETSVKVSWQTSSGFTVSGTATAHTVTTSGLPSSYGGEALSAWPGIGSSATSVSGSDVTFSSSDLSAGTQYGFFITGGITNPSTGNAGSKDVVVMTQTSGPTLAESTATKVQTMTTNGDQVTITASVPSSFTFTLSGNSIALGTLSTGSISTGTVTGTVTSNAGNGWSVWVRSNSSSPVLSSAASGGTIASQGTVNGITEALVAGTSGYALGVSIAANGQSTGTQTVNTEYTTNSTSTGGTLSTTLQEVANSTGIANGDVVTFRALAAISALVKAANDYTDTWNIVAAGIF